MSHRREEFDAITMGWGSDDAGDLTARLQLVKELREKTRAGLSPAEQKIEKAMQGRLVALGGYNGA